MNPLHVTFLYRLWDGSRVLLYVGITRDLGVRMRKHAWEKAWWEQVEDVTVEVFPTHDAAADAEAEAIQTERPRHNTAHRPKPQPTGAPDRPRIGTPEYAREKRTRKAAGTWSREPGSREDTLARLVEYLGGEWTTTQAVAKHLDVSPRYARMLLRDLMDRGLADRRQLDFRQDAYRASSQVIACSASNGSDFRQIEATSG